MTNEDYQNELLQLIMDVYENEYKKMLGKVFKTLLIIILIYSLLLSILVIQHITAGTTEELNVSTVFIAYLILSICMIYIALSAGKIKKDYIDPSFKKEMYNIQVIEPEVIIKNDTVFGIIFGSKKRKIMQPENVIQLVIINNRYYFLSLFQGYMLILDPVEGKKFLSQCSLKVQTRVKMVNHEYKFDEKLSSQAKNYSLKIMSLKILLKNIILGLAIYYVIIMIFKGN